MNDSFEPSLSDMIDYLASRNISIKGPKLTLSKIKKSDLIKCLYYRKKFDEVFNKYHGNEWMLLLEDITLWKDDLINPDTMFGDYYVNHWSHPFE